MGKRTVHGHARQNQKITYHLQEVTKARRTKNIFRNYSELAKTRLFSVQTILFQKGDIILDTHVGSASSLIACRNTGHKFVGFELSRHYFNLSLERYRQETEQMQIYDFIGDS